MKRLCIIAFLLVSGCSQAPVNDKAINTQAETSINLSHGETQIIDFSDFSVRLTHYDMENSEQCPSVAIISPDHQQEFDSISLCQVNIDGYRSLNATTDFAFIDFKNYQLTPQQLSYEIDLALLRGSSFIASCKLDIKNNRLIELPCHRKPGTGTE